MKALFNPDIKEVFNGYTEAVEGIASEIQDHAFSYDDELVEITSMNVKLLKAPEEDMAGLNALYEQAQSYYSRTCSILISFITERRFWKKLEIKSDKLYARSRSYLLTTEDLKNLRNQSLQEAQVDNTLQLLSSLVAIIKGSLSDVKELIEIAQIKLDELNNAITNLSRQQRVNESLIGLGYPVRTRRA